MREMGEMEMGGENWGILFVDGWVTGWILIDSIFLENFLGIRAFWIFSQLFAA